MDRQEKAASDTDVEKRREKGLEVLVVFFERAEDLKGKRTRFTNSPTTAAARI